MFCVLLILKLCAFKIRKYSLLNLEMYVIKQICYKQMLQTKMGPAEYPIRIFHIYKAHQLWIT